MSCNAVDVQNVFFWLLLIAGGVGASLGALLSLLIRPPGESKRRGGGLLNKTQNEKRIRGSGGVLVKISLFLSFSVLSVLIAIILIDVSRIEWNQFLITFFLIATSGWTLLYIGFRWLITPVLLILVLYIVLISGVVQKWGCCVLNDQLMQVKVIAQKEADNQLTTSLELRGPGEGHIEFKQVTGDQLTIALSTIHFRSWVFYPRCAFLFRVKDMYGGSGPISNGKSEMGWQVQFMRTIKLIDIKQIKITQPGLQLLHTYRLILDEKTPKFKEEL